MPIRFAALPLMMLLTACTHYHYINPQTPEGLACMHKLDAEVNACETRVREKQDSFNSLHEFMERSRQQCEHGNTFNIPNACPQPPSPTKVDNYCRDGYDEKFVKCGGRIEKIEQ
ncbi:hypothetical protein SAMN05216598_5113 [Pseudomonas asplenii]|uniref:Lipoprotein n=2 Tax=Pseudomonas asplenii TaxID=53407 RepID=A0A1H1ZJV8_9PSED|nr:hypothetical protein SAMN05216598_5113 [Pseudomonas asplenii]